MKARAPEALAIDTTMDNGLLVLGNVELKGRALHLSVNSAARAERGTALIQAALGERVGPPLTEIRTLEQLLAEGAKSAPEPAEIPAQEAERMVHELMDRQYRAVLDQPVPMLGDQAPRAAVKTAEGRRQVVDWL